jgi:signal transduction histidine kinase
MSGDRYRSLPYGCGSVSGFRVRRSNRNCLELIVNQMGLRDFLLARPGEAGERFQQERLAASFVGLRVLSAMEILLAGMAYAPIPVLIGLVTAAASLPKRSREWGPWICGGSILFWSLAMLLGPGRAGAAPSAALVLLAGAAICRARPSDLLGMAVLIWAAPPGSRLFLGVAIAGSAVVAGFVHAQRLAAYRSHLQDLQNAEILSTAPYRALLSENAKAVGKLSAALTHELNSPLGALQSGVDTLLVVAAKQASAQSPEEQRRLVAIQADLRNSIEKSSNRLREIIERLQLFVDLENADRQTADLNELLSDAALQVKNELKTEARIEFAFGPVTPVICRPQQLSVVFTSLLINAIQATGPQQKPIRIATAQLNAAVEVTVQDFGRGMSPEELETIFDPSFKVANGRISTGNWSLFNSRQIVFEHGGEIRIASTQGQGTTVSILLPGAI